MGAWIANFLSKNGYEVIINDTNRSAARKVARELHVRIADDQMQALESSQLVILATPTPITQTMLLRLAREDFKDKLFVEISSVKKPLKTVLRGLKEKGFSILSIHPMFGPGARSPKGRAVLVTPLTRKTRLAEEFLATLRKKGARLIKCSLDEHDKLIALVLILPHFLNAAFVAGLRALDVDLNLLSKAAGPTFRLQLLLAEEIHQENLDNETSMLLDNTYSIKTLKKYTQTSNIIANTIARRNRAIVLRSLRSGQKFLREDRQFSSVCSRFNEAALAASLH